MRTGGAVAIAVSGLITASALAAERLPWGWARSLPWTACERILWDSALIALPGALAVAVCTTMDARSGAVALGYLAYAAPRLAGFARRVPPGLTSLGAAAPAEILLVALFVGVSPWTGPLAAAALPWVLRDACRRERAQKPSAFNPRRYAPDGSPLG